MNVSSLDKRDNERLRRGGERTLEGQMEVEIKHNQTITPTPCRIGQYVVVVGMWSIDVSRKTSPRSKMAAHSFL